MKNEKKVSLFIFGAPKCGTTAMVDYLSQHPKIFFPNIKEPHYFCTDFQGFRRIQTSAEYDALFPFASSQYEIFGEASVWYLYSKDAAEQVFSYNPDAKIVVMLRNPVEMLPSLHTQLIFSGRENVTDFNKAWRSVARRRDGYDIPDNVLELSHLYYDEVCKYGEQLSRVLSVFPAENVKVIFFEDFKIDPKKAVGQVLSFIGLGGEFDFTANVVNKARKHKYPALSAFIRNPPFPLGLIKRFIKSFTFIKKMTPMRKVYEILSEDAGRPVVKEQVLEEIIDAYSSDISELSRICGRDLVGWRR